MRKLYVSHDVKDCWHTGDYHVIYTPWRVISFHTQAEADTFMLKLRQKLEQSKFSDDDVGFVLSLRDKIRRENEVK